LEKKVETKKEEPKPEVPKKESDVKAEAERVEKVLPNVDQKQIEKEALKSIDISSLFIKKVQNELNT